MIITSLNNVQDDDDYDGDDAGDNLPDYEIHEITKEIEACGKLAELRNALEVKGSDLDAKTVLSRWQKEMVAMGTPPRPRLLYHLARIGMEDLHSKLVFCPLLPLSFLYNTTQVTV